MLSPRHPPPDFDSFEDVLLGEREPDKVHFVEFAIDLDTMRFVFEKLMKRDFSYYPVWEEKAREFREGKEVPALTEEEKLNLTTLIDFYHFMGYDYVPLGFLPSVTLLMFLSESRVTITAGRKRAWVEEKEGIMKSWEDFDSFPWDRLKIDTRDYFSFVGEVLPEGMKATITSSLYEWVGERLLGYEQMFRKLYQEPDFVEAVFNKWGQIQYDEYERAIGFDCVGAIFHGDDLGYKKGLMISPKMLMKLVFPWFEKYSCLAHQHNKMYCYHVCGNVLKVMKNLIEDVKIDAFHSFQDNIMPVWEFKKRYGHMIGVLGGVDVDKMVRFDKETLGKYVRKILNLCMPGGRYALGSGNSITNYVPLENYLVMIEEGRKWKPRN